MKNLLTRIVKYILGLFVVTLGIALSKLSFFGVSPVSAIPLTMEILCGIKIGISTIIFQSYLLLLQIVILRKKFKFINLLQLPVCICFGFMTDLSVELVSYLPFIEMFFVRIAMTFIGGILIAIGLALYVPANLFPMPSEGFIKTISDVYKCNFSNIKIIFDCTVVAISAALCLIFTKSFGSIGLGTVFLAIFVGIINKLVVKLFKKIKIIK